MIHRPSRRDIVKTTMRLMAVSSLGGRCAAVAHAEEPAGRDRLTISTIDSMLRAATSAGEVPGVVALAATDDGILYEGSFGRRRGPRWARHDE